MHFYGILSALLLPTALAVRNSSHVSSSEHKEHTTAPYGATITTRTTITTNYSRVVERLTFTNTTWAPASNADQCWTEWQSFWYLHPPASASVEYSSSTNGSYTTTYTFTETDYSELKRPSTEVITSAAPTVIHNGAFTQTVSPSTVTFTTTHSKGEDVPVSEETSLNTATFPSVIEHTTTKPLSYNPAWPTPGCVLPSSYSGCQSEWESYASNQAIPFPPPVPTSCSFNAMYHEFNRSAPTPQCYLDHLTSVSSWDDAISALPKPICTQASITGGLCTSLKDAYVMGDNYDLFPLVLRQGLATFSQGFYSPVGPDSTSGWVWPTTQSLAQGCTLGCGRCAVTGGTIQLYYFQPNSHSATGPVVASTLGTVLTSPTYYISFESLYASDACSGVGSTITSTILAIPTSLTLSTLFATTRPCDAHFQGNPWIGTYDIGTASFNVTDILSTPVPYSIYTSQPYCAGEIWQAQCNPSACPTTLPYRPLIVLSSQALNALDPAWASCSADLRGLYDPPRALKPTTVAAGVTVPTLASTTSASPAATAQDTSPALTSQASSPVVQPSTAQSTATPSSGQNIDASPGPSVEHSSGSIIGAGASETVSAQPSQGGSAKSGGGSPSSTEAPTNVVASPSDQNSAAQETSIISTINSGTQNSEGNAGNTAVSTSAAAPSNALGALTAPTSASVGDASTAADPGESEGATPAASPTNALGALTAPTAGGDTASTLVDPGAQASQGFVAAVIASVIGLSSPQSTTSQVATGTQQSGSQPAPALSSPSGLPLAVDPSNSGHVIAGSVTVQAGQETTISGVPLSVGDGVVVASGSQTYSVAPSVTAYVPSAALTSNIVLGGTTLAAVQQDGLFSVDGTTLSVGGSGLVVAGQTLSVGSGGLFADDSTVAQVADQMTPVSSGATAAPANPTAGVSGVALPLGSATITAVLASSDIVHLGSQTLTPGEVVTVNGQVISDASSGLVLNGASTVAFSALQASSPAVNEGIATVLTIGSQAATEFSNGEVVIGSQTLNEGGPTATINGAVFSLGASGVVVDGFSTAYLPAIAKTSADNSHTSSATGDEGIATVLTIGSQPATELSDGDVVVGSQTLSQGGPAATMNGEVFSLASSGIVVDGSSTITLPAVATPSGHSSSGPSSTQGNAATSASSVPSGASRTAPKCCALCFYFALLLAAFVW